MTVRSLSSTSLGRRPIRVQRCDFDVLSGRVFASASSQERNYLLIKKAINFFSLIAEVGCMTGKCVDNQEGGGGEGLEGKNLLPSSILSEWKTCKGRSSPCFLAVAMKKRCFFRSKLEVSNRTTTCLSSRGLSFICLHAE